MTDFPVNFDFVIYGTGITESILSAALSTTGYTVLHIDRNSFYGGSTTTFRLGELINHFDAALDFSNGRNNDETGHVFRSDNIALSNIKNVEYNWFIEEADAAHSVEVNGNNNSRFNLSDIKRRLRMTDFELLPKLILCESKTVDFLIQSDVKRYLEFQFVSKFSTFSNENHEKLITMPVTRADIVRTKLFSLRQKRQLTSFLEWALTVNLQDSTIIDTYGKCPLTRLMTEERNMDEFIQKIIIDCLVMSTRNVTTCTAIEKVKRLLKSLNKIGPYPMLWVNYGTGEISQSFCRMSAVYGGVYCLETAITSVELQHSSENGDVEGREARTINSSIIPAVPIEQRKLKVRLSNGKTIYTDRIFSHKSYFNLPANIDTVKWIARCVMITNKSLLSGTERENDRDILLFPIYSDNESVPTILLELPTHKRASDQSHLYVVHLTLPCNTGSSPADLFSSCIDRLFQKYNSNQSASAHSENNSSPTTADTGKPSILFQCFYSIIDYENVDIATHLPSELADLKPFLLPVNEKLSDLEMDTCFVEASALMEKTCPGTQFLPTPPNPEDIIQIGDQAVSTIPNGDDESLPQQGEVNANTTPALIGDSGTAAPSQTQEPESLHLSSIVREIEQAHISSIIDSDDSVLEEGNDAHQS